MALCRVGMNANEQIGIVLIDNVAFNKNNDKYKINIENEEGSIIVFLEQISVTSKVCFDINLFFIKKFNAIPIQVK